MQAVCMKAVTEKEKNDT